MKYPTTIRTSCFEDTFCTISCICVEKQLCPSVFLKYLPSSFVWIQGMKAVKRLVTFMWIHLTAPFPPQLWKHTFFFFFSLPTDVRQKCSCSLKIRTHLRTHSGPRGRLHSLGFTPEISWSSQERKRKKHVLHLDTDLEPEEQRVNITRQEQGVDKGWSLQGHKAEPWTASVQRENVAAVLKDLKQGFSNVSVPGLQLCEVHRKLSGMFEQRFNHSGKCLYCHFTFSQTGNI